MKTEKLSKNRINWILERLVNHHHHESIITKRYQNAYIASEIEHTHSFKPDYYDIGKGNIKIEFICYEHLMTSHPT